MTPTLTPWKTDMTPMADRFASRGNDPFLALHGGMNRLFDEVLRDFGMTGSWPHVDITDKDDEILVEAELPGMEEKDVEVMLRDGVLTLRGERKDERSDEGHRVTERFRGQFERHIPLGAEIDEDKVTAQFANGELHITLPKTESEAPEAKKIEVKRAA